MKHKSRFLFEQNKLKHFIALILLYFIGVLAVLIIQPSYIENIILVYLPGTIYALGLVKNSKRKILLFALVSMLFIIPVEILARLTNSWDVSSLFPRLLGIAPLENIAYALINIIYPLAFYEFFFDNDRNRKISPNWKYLLAAYLVLFIGTFTIYFTSPEILKFDYWVIGIGIFIPVLTLLVTRKAHILKRLLIPAITFGLMFGIHEVVSMALGHWWWPGEYVLPITVFGHIYPVDDLIIWLLFSVVGVISGYEALWD